MDATPRNAWYISPAVITNRSDSFLAAFAVCSASRLTSRRDARNASDPLIDRFGDNAAFCALKSRAVARICSDACLSPEIKLSFLTDTETNASPALIFPGMNRPFSLKKGGLAPACLLYLNSTCSSGTSI